MKLYTIGFTKKSAKQFFDIISYYNIELLLDIRLNNKSQLSGFAKSDDLEYFLYRLCGCEYEYHQEFAPSKDLLNAYMKNIITWEDYVLQYNTLIIERGDYHNLLENYNSYKNICLLCSEATAENCHRRLLAELLTKGNTQIEVCHV